MPLVSYNSSLSLNIESIDNQHKQLIDMMNDFYDNIANRSNKENIAKLLAGLKNYVIDHFSLEEALMERLNYWDFKEHQAEHRQFIDKVNDMEKRFLNGQLILSLDVTSFLFDWLKNHIQRSDKKYSELFINNGIK